MSPAPSLQVSDGPEDLAARAAHAFSSAAARAQRRAGVFRVALSGGNTPLPSYRLLASEPSRFPVRWEAVEFFWSDERFVPPEDPQSNYGAARRALLGQLPCSPAGVFPIPTGADSPSAAAVAYEATLRTAFAGRETPRFDLVLLGLGTDGHTASLFPGKLPDSRNSVLVAAIRTEAGAPSRITLTPGALNGAREVVFLVSGARKADILRRVLRSEGPEDDLPATLVRPANGTLVWLADRAAASEYRRGIGEGG